MKKMLIKDLVIPVGTIFTEAPVKTERPGEGCFSAVIGLTNNTSGSIEYWCDADEDELAKWFADC